MNMLIIERFIFMLLPNNNIFCVVFRMMNFSRFIAKCRCKLTPICHSHIFMGHKITMMLINILKCIWIRVFEYSFESSNISYFINSSFFGIRIYDAFISNLIVFCWICKIRIRITFGLGSKLLSKSSKNSSWFMLIEEMN